MAFAGVFAGAFFLTGCNSSQSQPENQDEISEKVSAQVLVDYAIYVQNVDGSGYSNANNAGRVAVSIQTSAGASLASSTIRPIQSSGQLAMNFNTTTTNIRASITTTVTATGFVYSYCTINGIKKTTNPASNPVLLQTNGTVDFDSYGSIDLEVYIDRMQYSLSLDSNNGTFGDGTTTKQMSLYYQQGLSLASPTKYGYEFCGWIDDNDNEYDLSTFTMPASNLNLHAVWEAVQSVVRLEPQGGTIDTSNAWFDEQAGGYEATVRYGDQFAAIDALPTPTRKGYSFAGWYEKYYTQNLFDPNSFVAYMQSCKSSDLNYNASTGIMQIAGPYGYSGSNYYYYKPDLPAGTYTMSFKGWIDDSRFTAGSGHTTTAINVLQGAASNVRISSNVEAEYSYQFTIPADGSWSGFYMSYNYSYVSYVKDICLVRWGSTGSDTSVPNRIDSFERVDFVDDKTFYAIWLPDPVSITFGFAFEDDITGETYVQEASRTGFSYEAFYHLVDSGGDSTVYESETISSTTTMTLHQYSNIEIKNIIRPDGWVCVGLSSNVSSSASETQNISRTLTNSAQTFLVCFKKVSGNRLRYDYGEQYFYFEDGVFPQTAVVTYDNGFNNALGEGLAANVNVISNLETFVSNGITFYKFTYKESDATATYYTYDKQRFLGFASPHAKTLKLRDAANIIKEYTFVQDKLYFFRYDPIRWRVSDYGVSYTEYPTYWDLCGESQQNVDVVSDVLWLDAFNIDELKVGDWSSEASLMDKFAYNQVIGNESMNLQHSTIDTNIELNSYTSPSAGNQKVSENAGWGEPRFMRYIRFISNGSNKNAINHTSQIKVKFTDGSIVTYVDATTGTTTSHVSGLGALSGSGASAYYDGGNATINFGEIKSVSAILLRRYYPGGRTYYGQKIEYSLNGTVWYTYWDSYNTGSYSADGSTHDDTNLYAETIDGHWFDNGRARVASLKEIEKFMTDKRSRASHLVCVLTGQNQTRYAEYWTRDFGQQIGLGTSVSSTGTVVTNSAYDQSTEMRYLRFTSNGSTVNAGNHIQFIKVYDKLKNETVVVDAVSQTSAPNIISGLYSRSEDGSHSYFNTAPVIVVDLGQIKTISSVKLRRYYSGGRSYYSQKVEYSTDGETWNTYWDSGNTGSYGKDDQTGLYAETAAGRTFTLGGPNIKGVRFAITMSESSNGGRQNLIKGLETDSTGTGNTMNVAYYVASNNFTLTNTSSVTNDPYVTLPSQTVYLEAGKTYKMRLNSTLVSGTVRGTQIQVFFGINKKYTETNSLRFNGVQNVWKEFSVTTTGTYNIRIDNDVTYTAGGVVNITNFEIVEA